MAVFIKQTFRNPNLQKLKKQAKIKKIKSRTHSLTNLLGEFTKNFKKNLDELWQECDYDDSGLLDKVQCRDFMNEA